MTRGLMVRAGRKLRGYAHLLMRQRAEIVVLLDGLQPGAPDPGGSTHEHPAEAAAALYDQEETLTIRRWLRQRLAEVDAALVRIEDGTYGRCEVCGMPIEPARLEAIPWVRTRVECQRLLEQRPPGAEPVRGC